MPGQRRDDSWWRYADAKPIPVDDGIATSRARGEMAEQWWSKRFVEVLDAYGLGGRMQRGRRYARTGQLKSFSVEPGKLHADVQGSRRTPYRVTVHAPTTSEAQWAEVDAVLASQVKFAARLLAGDVPGELEGVFASAGVALLPRRWSDVSATCNCPDNANPCKHIAATLYVFADRLDDDPWLLLEWRGRTREQILGPLVPHAADPAGQVRDAGTVGAREVAPWWPLDPQRERPLAGGRSIRSDAARLRDVDPPDPAESVLRRLDDLAIEIRGTPIKEFLPEAYRAATAEAKYERPDTRGE